LPPGSLVAETGAKSRKGKLIIIVQGFTQKVAF